MLLTYSIIINLLGLAIMRFDKSQAKWPGARRVPERAIIIISLAGGAVGVYLGMQMFRHKTRHLKFTLGVPLILVLQIALFMVITRDDFSM